MKRYFYIFSTHKSLFPFMYSNVNFTYWPESECPSNFTELKVSFQAFLEYLLCSDCQNGWCSGKMCSSNLFCLPKRTLILFLAGPIYFVSVTVPSPGSDNAPAGVNQNLNSAERFWGNICKRDARRASLSSA